jgi:hypothetical protein
MVVSKHGENRFHSSRGLTRSLRNASAKLAVLFSAASGSVVYSDLMASLNQPAGHRRAHTAKTNESYFH